MGRYSQQGQIYMVTSTVRGRRPVFSDWQIGRLLVAQFREAQELGFAHSLAWVVMPDHFHWMFELQQTTVNKLVQRVKSKSGIAVNKARGTTGSIWQDGYHDVAVRREEDVVRFARYIVANPLRAGLVRSLGDYALWDPIWLQPSGPLYDVENQSRASSLPPKPCLRLPEPWEGACSRWRQRWRPTIG